MTTVVSVRFRSGCKTYFFDPRELTVETGQDIIVETAQGLEYAQCTLGNGYSHIAFDGGANDGRKLVCKIALVHRIHGNRITQPGNQCLPITQQEIEQIQHDTKAHDKAQGVLSQLYDLPRQQLARLGGNAGEFVLNGLCRCQIDALQKADQPAWHGSIDLLEVGAKVDLAFCNTVVNQYGFVSDRKTNQYQRKNDP
mgnify:CR=1 FL=1